LSLFGPRSIEHFCPQKYLAFSLQKYLVVQPPEVLSRFAPQKYRASSSPEVLRSVQIREGGEVALGYVWMEPVTKWSTFFWDMMP
jgi:hypothetical protein